MSLNSSKSLCGGWLTQKNWESLNFKWVMMCLFLGGMSALLGRRLLPARLLGLKVPDYVKQLSKYEMKSIFKSKSNKKWVVTHKPEAPLLSNNAISTISPAHSDYHPRLLHLEYVQKTPSCNLLPWFRSTGAPTVIVFFSLCTAQKCQQRVLMREIVIEWHHISGWFGCTEPDLPA